MKLNKFLQTIKTPLALIMIFIIIYFIYTEFKKSNLKLIDIAYKIQWPMLPLAIIIFCLYFFFTSLGMRYLLNNNSIIKIPILKNFGIFNISGLTKYLPGKIWSYAIMFYALKEHGIFISKAVFDSLIHLILTITTPLLLMMPVAIFLFFPQLCLNIKLLLIILGFILYITCLFSSPYILKMIVNVINFFKKKEPIIYTMLSRKNIIITQIYILTGYIFYIISISFIVNSIESSFNFTTSIQISIICIFSATIGFIVLIVPGGIGVQESLIYFFTSINQTDSGFSFILPVIVRLVSVITDLIVGLTSLWIIRKLAVNIIFNKSDSKKKYQKTI
jgi:uncharacterized membrane protein YbhN (UPF0104 family)